MIIEVEDRLCKVAKQFVDVLGRVERAAASGDAVHEVEETAWFGLIEVGRAADFVFMDRAQHTAGATLLESVQLGDIPGIGMVMIDGLVRCGRSRNTPPATEIPVVL